MADESAGADLLWLAAGVIGLLWLLRPVPGPAAGTGQLLASAYLPAGADAAPAEAVVMGIRAFDPALDGAPLTITPFVEHGPMELVPAIVDEMPLSPVPIIVDTMPLSPVGPWLMGPFTLEEWEPWIRSRPVVQAYPELTGMLRDALERDLASGAPGVVPWRAEALTEQYAHDAYGWARSAASTPIGTPTDPGILDTRPFPYNNP